MSDPVQKITCLYTCPQCSLLKVPLDVPARAGEEIKTWLDQTMQYISADHKRRSSNCHAATVDLMIPILGANVGGAAVN